jgi:hypothetical protein
MEVERRADFDAGGRLISQNGGVNLLATASAHTDQ